MKVKQKDADGINKHVEGLRTDIREALAAAAKFLDPANQEEIGQNVHAAITATAATLSSVIQGLSHLAVAHRWKDAIEKAMVAPDDGVNNTQEAVADDMSQYLTHTAIRLENTLMTAGPSAALYKQMVVQNAAGVVSTLEMMIKGHEFTKNLCEEIGVDFVKVEAGDKDALKTVLLATEQKTGVPTNPRVLAALGLDDDAPAGEPMPSSQDDLADALGLGGGQENDGPSEGGAAIRA